MTCIATQSLACGCNESFSVSLVRELSRLHRLCLTENANGSYLALRLLMGLTPKPSLQPTCSGWLREPAPAAELER